MTEYCSVEKEDHIFTVTIERPERLNALHPPANRELGDVFDEFGYAGFLEETGAEVSESCREVYWWAGIFCSCGGSGKGVFEEAWDEN